ncbi:hypothetical protein [Anaeromassilibacillus sp. An200]|uniref:hypothetical protein n=1 Tax=Anaeromassilibacillus sp. An200 TaxID=1965587 RepID=UPI000B3AD536|nr:hypothetical protein [Anaeromassilibacillus sp. An200]OUP04551.1 hypothetical protein B5F35_17565 [Anaeromassilibacillus sp. An200]
MNISSTTISGSLYIPNTRNAVAKGMSQAASTKFSREDTVEISGKKDAENTSATTEFENNTSLPDAVVENIRRMAREDAKKGVYMDEEYVAYRYAYKNQHISPDRPKLLMGLNKILSTLPHIVNRFQTFSLMGCRATVDFYSSFSAFYNSNGEKIMTCDSDGDVMEFPTKAESKYYSETTAVYAEAYDAARAEMKATAQG